MRILGVDPGFGRTGWGVIDFGGSQMTAVDYGCIETKSGEDFSDRLEMLYNEIFATIKKFKPDLVAVEELFFYKNVTTAIKVSHARGAILLAAKKAGLAVAEFTPLQVKQAVSGYGGAEKGQVQRLVQTFLRLKELPKPDDAADALAIAICASGSIAIQKLQMKN
jgi:crossover junction endodeoxyribonuclease RuvC